jgi:hypothetical protein
MRLEKSSSNLLSMTDEVQQEKEEYSAQAEKEE